jgi:hypothetical protein
LANALERKPVINKTNCLKVFYAATTDSVYYVMYESHWTVATRICMFGLPVAPAPASRHTISSPAVGIGKRLVALQTSENSAIEHVSPIAFIQWEGTSDLKALFLNKVDAEAFNAMDKVHQRSSNFIEKTRETLSAIGDQHPGFKIFKDPKYALKLAGM